MQRRQRELLRLAYLLTGDAERARELTAAALLDLLRNPPEQFDQPAQELGLHLAQRYVRDPNRSTWLNRADDAHYTVDDERMRTKAALDRLSPEQRATLVLGQLVGVPAETVQRALGGDHRRAEQPAPPEARLAQAVGRAADAPVVDLLNRVLIDAPSVDLWPDLEAPLQRAWSARRRSERFLTAGVLGALVLLLGVSAIWLGGFRPGRADGATVSGADASRRPAWPPIAEQIPTPTVALASFAAAPTIALPAGSIVTVADLQLLQSSEQSGGDRSSLEIYDPATNTARPLLTAGGPPLISPDGRWIVAADNPADASGMTLLAGGALDGSASWEARIATPRALTLSSTQLYALSLQADGVYAIHVLDLTNGELLAHWPVERTELAASTIRSALLMLAPTGDRLTLLTTRIDREQERWLREMAVYHPDSGEVLVDTTSITSSGSESGAFSVGGARPVPDANALYSLVQDEGSAEVHLQFLDLDTGTVSDLLLPLEARSIIEAARRGEMELHLVPSNTGAVLYVIQSRQRQVVVVDMRARSLIGVFPLTAGAADRGNFASNLNHLAYAEALLSPDGARLYLAVNRERHLALNSYPSQAPVWVIDTTTWEVRARWTVGGMPRRMTMSADGARIYVRAARADGSVHLTTLATATGETLNVWEELPAPEWASFQRVDSVVQLYHEQYGLRPRSGPEVPRDNPQLAVLPGISVEAESAVAGAETEVTARIVHPLTGELATTDRTLRFDPLATLAIHLSNGTEQAIFVPASVEPGVYRGRVRLNAAGNWNARVTVINRDGTSWMAEQPGAIDVKDGLIAEDGGAYHFLVRPANPVNRRSITLRVWMVESQSRDRLPEEIELLDQIGEDVRIVLTHAGGERVDEPLVRLDHASFLGWARFGAAGLWSAEIEFGLASGARVSMSAGTIEITDLTEPYRQTKPEPSGDAQASD